MEHKMAHLEHTTHAGLSSRQACMCTSTHLYLSYKGAELRQHCFSLSSKQTSEVKQHGGVNEPRTTAKCIGDNCMLEIRVIRI